MSGSRLKSLLQSLLRPIRGQASLQRGADQAEGDQNEFPVIVDYPISIL
jgi:hypothetical protein